ncbi:thiamine pyrophosphate-dependent enzyme [Fervidicoccus sp.]|uniref:thiamine pyrophosphate-dependent enzyme n=1 Tax=Fervidicoccus sp. TaxID=2060324 RepID=UPI003D110515
MIMQSEFKSLREIPPIDYYTAGRRTCAGCGPAIGYRLISKAAGPNTIFIGPTGCMYVANAHQFLTSPYSVPWHHTQLGGGGAAAIGIASALRILMLKGKRKPEDINVIVMGGDGAMADIGLSGLSMGLSYDYQRLLYIVYDNEGYMNTGVQASSTTPWGATTTFTPSGKVKPLGNTRYKKNVALIAASHPNVKYVATATLWPPLDLMNKVVRALNSGGPSVIHALFPCPKGWFTSPADTVMLSKLAVETGMWVLWELIEGQFKLNYRPNPRKHVREYLSLQGRFRHLKDEDIDKMDKMIEEEWFYWNESAKQEKLILPY